MAGRELEMENACVAAAARVVLSTLMQSRNSSEAALATVMKTLKGQMSRHNDAVRKLNEAAGTSDGDGAAATKVHEMLEQMRATIPRSIGLLQRKEDSSNVFFLSEVFNQTVGGYVGQAARDLLAGVANLLLCSQLNVMKKLREEFATAQMTLLEEASQAFVPEKGVDQAVADELMALIETLVATAERVVDLSSAVYEGNITDPFAAENADLQEATVEVIEGAKGVLSHIDRNHITVDPTAEVQAAQALREGVAEVMNFAADFDAALTLWMGIAEQLASNSGRALLAPLLRDLRSEADKISVIFTHFQLEGFELSDYANTVAEIKAACESLTRNRTAAIATDLVAKAKALKVDLEIAVVDHLNQLMRNQPDLCMVIDPSVHYDADDTDKFTVLGFDPNETELVQWCTRVTQGYEGVLANDLTADVWSDGLALCAILHRHDPSLIDWDSLEPENMVGNLNAAFTATESLGLPLPQITLQLKNRLEKRTVLPPLNGKARTETSILSLKCFLAQLRVFFESAHYSAMNPNLDLQFLNSPARKATKSGRGRGGTGRNKDANGASGSGAGDAPASASSAVVSEAVIRIRGNLLMKKSPPKKWKKRYFTLRGTTIYYHDKERDALGDAYDASAKGSMPLGDCMVAQTDEFPKEFLFVVMSNVSDETLMFKAATAEERDMWVNELEAVIGGGSGAGSDDGGAAGGAAAAAEGKDGAEAAADEPVAGDGAGADGPSGASGSGDTAATPTAMKPLSGAALLQRRRALERKMRESISLDNSVAIVPGDDDDDATPPQSEAERLAETLARRKASAGGGVQGGAARARSPLATDQPATTPPPVSARPPSAKLPTRPPRGRPKNRTGSERIGMDPNLRPTVGRETRFASEGGGAGGMSNGRSGGSGDGGSGDGDDDGQDVPPVKPTSARPKIKAKNRPPTKTKAKRPPGPKAKRPPAPKSQRAARPLHPAMSRVAGSDGSTTTGTDTDGSASVVSAANVESDCTDDLIYKASIRALQWAKRVMQSTDLPHPQSRDTLFSSGKELRKALMELRRLVGVQGLERSDEEWLDQNEVCANMCDTLFDSTTLLIRTCRDIIKSGTASHEQKKQKGLAMSTFADAVATIVSHQSTKKVIRQAAVEACKCAKDVRDSLSKGGLMAAADAFVPSSKHLIELVTRRCQGIPVLDTKEFMLEHCDIVNESTHLLISATMQAARKSDDMETQTQAVEAFSAAIAAIIARLKD